MYLILDNKGPWETFHILTGSETGKSSGLADAEAIEVFVRGYPYDRESGKWLSAGDIPGLYGGKGASLADRIEGSFTILILDRPQKRCLVIVDPYKIYTLFYGRPDKGRIVISDSVGEIAGRMPGPLIDETGILEFANFGFVLGDRTLIDGVRSFRAASVHTINDRLEIGDRPYWNILGGAGSASAGDLACAFDTHISRGLSLEKRISMPLTGGLDSRTVLSACMKDKDRLHCYTHGRRGSDDVEISEKIARKFGISWDFYEIGGGIAENIPALADSMTGPCNGLLNVVTSSHFLSSYRRESGRGDIFFSGIGGELLRSYYLHSGAGACKSPEDFAVALRHRIRIYPEPGVFAGMSGADAGGCLDGAILAELSRYGTEDIQKLSECFYLENRVGNFTALSMRLVGEYFALFNPFLERDMLQLVPALPAREKRGIGLQKRIILRNCPELGAILMDRARILSGGKAMHGFAYLARRSLVLARIHANKISRRPLFNFSFTDYPAWLKKYHRDYVLDLLDHDNMLMRGMLRKNELERLRTRFLAADGGLCPLLTNIMSAELFLRHLAAKPGPGPGGGESGGSPSVRSGFTAAGE